jgi:hypothetical protein
VLAAEHLLDLGCFDLALQLLEATAEVGFDRFALFQPFSQDDEVLAALFQRVAKGDVLLQATAALQQFLRLDLVRPEVGLSDALLDACGFVVESGSLKDNSACRRTAS